MIDGAGLGQHEAQLAGSFDRPAIDFRAICSERLLALARIECGERVLDVATSADAPLEFPDNSFDTVICNLGMRCSPNMLAGLGEWRRVTKPGGRAMFSSLGASAFRPLWDLFEERLRRYGVAVPSQKWPLSKQRLIDPEECRALLLAAGFDRVEVRTEQLGYCLRDARTWWEIVSSSGFFDVVQARLPADRLQQFRDEHLAEVDALATERGIWIDLATIFASGRKE